MRQNLNIKASLETTLSSLSGDIYRSEIESNTKRHVSTALSHIS